MSDRDAATEGARGGIGAPHPPLTDYFAAETERRRWVRGLFDRTAADYERVESTLAFGSGAWYRGAALRRAGLGPGMRFVDVGTGTGLVARAAIRIVGDARLVTGIDPSAGMLAHNRVATGARLLEGDAEALPLPDASADFLAMGYALRHVSDVSAAFREFFRVLAPGGTVCVLEITRPAGRISTRVLRLYIRGLLPLLGGIVGRSADTPTLIRYYWDTIEACAPPERILETLAHAGFAAPRRHVTLGVFSEYTARKPGAA
jgi:demethylmenaquinone methyltransferase/2-methoxy-6-polyprenyl-1,4-benzoquinol methylase